MSGHSKWAQIKRQKGVADIKKGQAFTKLANAITIAIRQGGDISDPEANFKLRLAIEKARAANLPKENIERAIQHAQGKQAGEIEEIVYEGYGPGGVAVIAEGATDNKQRTTSEIRNIFEKNGGSLGIRGAVSYLFDNMGMITVAKNGKGMDEIMLTAIDIGALEVEEAGELVEIYTKVDELKSIKQKLESQGFKIGSMDLVQKPKTTVSITDVSTAQKILSFMEKLECLDDIQKVYSNFDIPDKLLEEVRGF